MTILMVSHYLEELDRICNMRGFLHRGRILGKEEWDRLALGGVGA